jgi:integrase
VSARSPRVRRPSPQTLGPYHARVVRGPDTAGRWYWRVWEWDEATRSEISHQCFWSGDQKEVYGVLQTLMADAPLPVQHVTTLRELLECWIAYQCDRTDISAATVHHRRYCARALARVVGAERIEVVGRATLERFRDRRLGENSVHVSRSGKRTDTGERISAATVRAELVQLRSAWLWGREIGVIPLRDLPRIRVRASVQEKPEPTRDELVQVHSHLDGWAKLAMLLYTTTGARLTEVASLIWRSVDLERAVLTVEGKMGRRAIPLSAAMAGLLTQERARRQPAPEDRVLECSPATARGIHTRLEVACRLAGVPRISPGTLRRLAVATLYRSGADPSVAAAVLGHSPTVARAYYRQVNLGDVRTSGHNCRHNRPPRGYNAASSYFIR